MKKSFLIVLFLCFAFPALFAANEVAQVFFKQEGSFQFPAAVLRDNVQTKKGLMFSERIVNDDVRRLYALGVFADVVSMVEDLPDGRKNVTFRVTAKPVVNSIVFEGNKKYDDKKLKEFLTVSPGSPLNEKKLNDSAAALRKFYDDEGLKDSKIVPLQMADGDGVKLVFKITENLRIRIQDVNFEGATIYPVKEMRSALETRYSPLSVNWLSWLPLQGGMGLLDREALERDRVRLRELYWRKGYLDFKIKKIRLEEADGNPEKVNVIFEVEEGEPYFVGKVRIRGNTKFSEEELLELRTLAPDDVYNSQKDDAFMKAVEAKYLPLGYADFMIRTEKRPNFETHTVDLDYTMREGPPYTIGEIYISGNKWTKDHVIRREIPLYPDDPVDQSMINITKNRLLGMGYFQGKAKDDPGVDIVAANSPEPGKKDIFINVKEKNFLDAKIGAGFSDTDSLAGMIELSHSNVDILDPKNMFTGGGQRFRVMGIAGIEHMGFEADFTEPWLFGIPLRLDISGYWREVMYDDWNERRIGFKIALTKRIFDDFTTISGGYLFEHVNVYDMAKKLSPKFHEWEGGDFVGRIFLSLDRDTRNSATNPTSGYFIGAHAALSSRGLGGSQDYYKFELRGVNYYPFFHDWFVLSTGFKIGTMGTFDNDKSIPLYDRYFLGGGDSVRGFPYRSIGPTDSNDDNYGGQFMYILTAELSHPIWEMIRGAVFVDVGSATSGTVGPINQANVGVGYGLRIKLPSLPVPIRLDLAYPVLSNQDGLNKKLRFHFSMGVGLAF